MTSAMVSLFACKLLAYAAFLILVGALMGDALARCVDVEGDE